MYARGSRPSSRIHFTGSTWLNPQASQENTTAGASWARTPSCSSFSRDPTGHSNTSAARGVGSSRAARRSVANSGFAVVEVVAIFGFFVTENPPLLQAPLAHHPVVWREALEVAGVWE